MKTGESIFNIGCVKIQTKNFLSKGIRSLNKNIFLLVTALFVYKWIYSNTICYLLCNFSMNLGPLYSPIIVSNKAVICI